jgi:hexosaminidase
VPAVLNETQAKHILGAQANLWTEYIGNTSKVEYMMFPRMMALSEVLWSPKEKRNYADFERRLPSIFARLDKQKINYSKAYYDLQATVVPAENNEGVEWLLESKDKNAKIMCESVLPVGKYFPYTKPLVIKENTILMAHAESGSTKSATIKQYFHFNKATGQRISLVTPPSKNYPGDGAFTLVNGVQNEKGLARSNEFLGFSGKDLDATIDLYNPTSVSKITVHVLDQNGSWIYLPSSVEITYLPNMDLTPEIIAGAPKEIKIIDPIKDKGLKTIVVEAKHDCRFLHVVVKNFGTIPSGNPGAGTPAWLFVDEIEVE